MNIKDKLQKSILDIKKHLNWMDIEEDDSGLAAELENKISEHELLISKLPD